MGGQSVRMRRFYSMFDIVWMALTLGLFGVGIAFLSACERM
jgi:hypothetical protein